MKKYIIFLLFISLNFCAQNRGIEIYIVKTINSPNKDCNSCFDISKENLSNEPLLETTDINYFDWEKQQFVLTSTGKNKLKELTIPLSGLPVVFVINDEPIYGFWFWTLESSFSCDRVFTYPKIDFKLDFGLPSGYAFGTDPRYDSKIKNFLKPKQ